MNIRQAIAATLTAAGIATALLLATPNSHPDLAGTDTGITVQLPGDRGAMQVSCEGDTLTFATTDIATATLDCETTTTTTP